MISNTTQWHSYAGTGAQFTFAYAFRILSSAEISVVVVTNATGVETLKAYGSDYALSNVGSDSGGNVVFAVAPLATETVIIYRNPAFTQPNDWTTPDAFSEGVIEDGYDRAAMGILAIKRITDKLGLNWKNDVLRLAGGPSIYQGTAPPISGPWKVGDIAINTSPSSGGSAGWMCTSAGVPGTWHPIPLTNLAWVPSAGFVTRSKFAWASTTSITIGPGVYDVCGASRKTVYWDSTITFVLGPAGSNPSSSALGANAWQYIYINPASSPQITSPAGFINSTQVPTYQDALHGWYDVTGTFRCIFAVRTTAGSQLWGFTHDGDFVSYADAFSDLAYTVIDVAQVDVRLTLPAISRSAQILAIGQLITTAKAFYWRTKGDAYIAVPKWLATAYGAAAVYPASPTRVATDASGYIQVWADGAGDSRLAVQTHGWYFGIGT